MQSFLHYYKKNGCPFYVLFLLLKQDFRRSQIRTLRGMPNDFPSTLSGNCSCLLRGMSESIAAADSSGNAFSGIFLSRLWCTFSKHSPHKQVLSFCVLQKVNKQNVLSIKETEARIFYLDQPRLLCQAHFHFLLVITWVMLYLQVCTGEAIFCLSCSSFLKKCFRIFFFF